MSEKTYSLIQNHREANVSTDTVLYTGLPWEAAEALRNKCQADFRAEHPDKTSWTTDIFWLELERKA